MEATSSGINIFGELTSEVLPQICDYSYDDPCTTNLFHGRAISSLSGTSDPLLSDSSSWAVRNKLAEISTTTTWERLQPISTITTPPLIPAAIPSPSIFCMENNIIKYSAKDIAADIFNYTVCRIVDMNNKLKKRVEILFNMKDYVVKDELSYFSKMMLRKETIEEVCDLCDARIELVLCYKGMNKKIYSDFMLPIHFEKFTRDEKYKVKDIMSAGKSIGVSKCKSDCMEVAISTINLDIELIDNDIVKMNKMVLGLVVLDHTYALSTKTPGQQSV
ncbi:MAG: hypothetical protein QS748_01525 [Candidatus Endonucleobacter bathymodioli]|uniref:Uncharacterized protein n=1 Tax=Candidatus Endonucleibacter bathymodioli TaxID=539814 RepID=A0AA90NJY2_9GAMM|nr:hypothetical protein [Candidatus Endonucleobacter bathymodioli]